MLHGHGCWDLMGDLSRAVRQYRSWLITLVMRCGMDVVYGKEFRTGSRAGALVFLSLIMLVGGLDCSIVRVVRDYKCTNCYLRMLAGESACSITVMPLCQRVHSPLTLYPSMSKLFTSCKHYLTYLEPLLLPSTKAHRAFMFSEHIRITSFLT